MRTTVFPFFFCVSSFSLFPSCLTLFPGQLSSSSQIRCSTYHHAISQSSYWLLVSFFFFLAFSSQRTSNSCFSQLPFSFFFSPFSLFSFFCFFFFSPVSFRSILLLNYWAWIVFSPPPFLLSNIIFFLLEVRLQTLASLSFFFLLFFFCGLQTFFFFRLKKIFFFLCFHLRTHIQTCSLLLYVRQGSFFFFWSTEEELVG